MKQILDVNDKETRKIFMQAYSLFQEESWDCGAGNHYTDSCPVCKEKMVIREIFVSSDSRKHVHCSRCPLRMLCMSRRTGNYGTGWVLALFTCEECDFEEMRTSHWVAGE